MRDFNIYKKLISLISCFFAGFYLFTSGFGIFSTGTNLAFYLLFTAVLVMMIKPMRKGKKNTWWMDIIDVVIIIALATSILYWLVEMPVYVNTRLAMPNTMDFIMGISLVFLSLEVTRRMLGWIMSIIGLFTLFILYFSPHLPGMLHHRGMPLRIIVPYMYFTDGIFGTIASVFSVFIMPFMVFGAFMRHSGGGEFFVRFCTAAAGKISGGPAMIAVIGSGILGSITGSPVANVVSTGNFTIPLMKSVGYKPEFAGAVEASASVGGTYLPPVMGAGAFILSATTNTPYATVMAMALVPALLYFLAVGTQVYFNARRNNIGRMSKDEIPSWRAELKKGWYFFGALVVLTAGLFAGWSVPRVAFVGCMFLYACSFLRRQTKFTFQKDWYLLGAPLLAIAVWGTGFFVTIPGTAPIVIVPGFMRITSLTFEPSSAAFWGCAYLFICSIFRKDVSFSPKRVYQALADAGIDSLYAGAAAGTMGIVMAGLTLHGLGLSLAHALLSIAGDSLFVLMLLTSFLGLILGMGLTLTSSYLLLSIMAGPALIGFGLAPAVAHFICLWLSMISHLCPPLALSAITAAGIAKADHIKTSLLASMLGIFLYLMPFTMAYSPQIMVVGHAVGDVVQIIFFYIFIIMALCATAQGWLFRNLELWERAIPAICIPLLMWPLLAVNLVGFVIFVTFAVLCRIQAVRARRSRPTAAA